MSIICPKCGASVEDGSVFCDECGEKLQNITKKGRKNGSSGIIMEEKKSSKMGIASFVLGIVSLVTCGVLLVTEILGLIFGIIAVNDLEHKNTLAIAGLVMSAIATLLIIIAIIFA